MRGRGSEQRGSEEKEDDLLRTITYKWEASTFLVPLFEVESNQVNTVDGTRIPEHEQIQLCKIADVGQPACVDLLKRHGYQLNG